MTTAPAEIKEPTSDEAVDFDRPWLVIVWNDPINLMSYVTYVLQKLFGYSKEKAHKLMLEVHYDGKAIVASGTRRSPSSTCSGSTSTASGRRCSGARDARGARRVSRP